MFDFTSVFEFSRHQCGSICTFLIPANLLATTQTLLFLFLSRPQSQLNLSVSLAIVLAMTLFIHVSTWLMIGIITPVTFVLFGLGSTCLAINLWAIVDRYNFEHLLQNVLKLVTRKLSNLTEA